jgi:hypothetical protein
MAIVTPSRLLRPLRALAAFAALAASPAALAHAERYELDTLDRWTRAAEIDPSSEEAQLLAARRALVNGEASRAKNLANAFLERLPLSPYRADALLERGDPGSGSLGVSRVRRPPGQDAQSQPVEASPPVVDRRFLHPRCELLRVQRPGRCHDRLEGRQAKLGKGIVGDDSIGMLEPAGKPLEPSRSVGFRRGCCSHIAEERLVGSHSLEAAVRIAEEYGGARDRPGNVVWSARRNR